MTQQTSIFDFFRSVNPKHQFKTKAETIGVNFSPKNNLKTKTLGSGKIKKEPPPAVSRSESAKTSSNKLDFIDLVDSDEEADLNSQKTPKLSRNVSFESKSPSTPDNGKNNRKRTFSGSRNSPNTSPRKKAQSNGSRSVTKHLKHRTQRRLCHESIDTGRVSDMIENLNLSRVGLFPKNNFNLEICYSEIGSKAKDVDHDIDQISIIYDSSRVIIPTEKHAEHLFRIVTEVFSIPSNCGYFNDQELDMVFGILTLSEKAQMLFARMIKRKRCWKRSNAIKYPEIDQNLKPYFDQLEEHKLIASDLANLSLEMMLDMLSADEVQNICLQSKMARQSNKELAIKGLLKNCGIKSLFPGVESPAMALRKRVVAALDHCVCLPKDVTSLVDRIITLFIPSEDVTSELSHIFLKLTYIKEGTLRFPEVPSEFLETERYYPIFQNREHLIRYVERKNEWKQALDVQRKGVKNNWEILRTLARDAHYRLMLLLGQNQSSSQQLIATPRHVQKFNEEYVCIKIITTCIEVFKKENSTVDEAVNMLKHLIKQESYLQNRKAGWYEELALIEMKYKKNLEAAALTIIEGLTLKNITESGKHVLNKRASILAKRKSGISSALKSQLENHIDKETPKSMPTVSIDAKVMQGNQPGRKSTWSLNMGSGDKGYMSVELRALCEYRNNGYPEGWHCEGALPITLFTLIFWEELYRVPVPAAYLSAYQDAPLDLFTSEFYKNRKEHIDKRMEDIEALSGDQLGSSMEESLEIRQHYQTLMPRILPIKSTQLRDIVRCMGTTVVAGICKKLALNFNGWRAGFPDLFVWNPITLRCKFVEVKGPGDTLSAKQTLWLRYLESLDAATELCEVKATAKNQ